MSFDELLAKIEHDYDMDDSAAHLLFDEVSTWVLERAAEAWPTMTRDTVSRGLVKTWLLELAHGETEYL